MEKIEDLNQKIHGGIKFYNILYDKIKEEEKTNSRLYLHYKVVKKMTTMAGQLCLIKCEQYFRNNCIKNGNVYEITHSIEGKLYKILIKAKRGPIDEYDPYSLGYECIVDPKEYVSVYQ